MANLVAKVLSFASHVWKRPHTKPGWHRPRSSEGEYCYYKTSVLHFIHVQLWLTLDVMSYELKCVLSSDTSTTMQHPRNKVKVDTHPLALCCYRQLSCLRELSSNNFVHTAIFMFLYAVFSCFQICHWNDEIWDCRHNHNLFLLWFIIVLGGLFPRWAQVEWQILQPLLILVLYCYYISDKASSVSKLLGIDHTLHLSGNPPLINHPGCVDPPHLTPQPLC